MASSSSLFNNGRGPGLFKLPEGNFTPFFSFKLKLNDPRTQATLYYHLLTKMKKQSEEITQKLTNLLNISDDEIANSIKAKQLPDEVLKSDAQAIYQAEQIDAISMKIDPFIGYEGRAMLVLIDHALREAKPWDNSLATKNTRIDATNEAIQKLYKIRDENLPSKDNARKTIAVLEKYLNVLPIAAKKATTHIQTIVDKHALMTSVDQENQVSVRYT